MAKKPETLLKEKTLKVLKSLPNSWWVKIQQVAIIGTPDILGTINGHFIAIELKTDDGKLSEIQKHNLIKITSCGAVALILMPSNFDECIKLLEKLANNNSRYLKTPKIFQ
jgi:hypothetical protein